MSVQTDWFGWILVGSTLLSLAMLPVTFHMAFDARANELDIETSGCCDPQEWVCADGSTPVRSASIPMDIGLDENGDGIPDFLDEISIEVEVEPIVLTGAPLGEGGGADVEDTDTSPREDVQRKPSVDTAAVQKALELIEQAEQATQDMGIE